jgi:hypothetical protein
MVAMLIGCGLRRAELLALRLTLAVALSTALASTLVMMDTFDVTAFSAGGAENRIASS